MAKRSSRQKRFSRDDERLYIDPIRSPEVQARREAAMRAVTQVPPDQQVRRDEALQRMADIKKSYEFWQELVNKNMRKKIKQRQAAEAQRATEGMGSSDCLHDGANEGAPPNFDDSIAADCHDFFSEQDLRFLRTRLDEIVSQNGIQLQDGEVERLLESCVVEAKMNQGFDPYGIEDEEGLHGGNSGLHEPGCNGECEDEDEDDEDDDYHMDDAKEETILHNKSTTHHHIDVELRAGKDDTSGHGDCGSACEFTFEYDRDGKLIPTSSNIEEKLRLMNLQSEVSREAISSAQAHAQAMAMAITSSAGRKKKSQRKKRKGKSEDVKTNCTHEGENACLFCRYEEFYGVKPVLHMRKQDFTHRCELERRMKIRDKLENVKSDRRAHHEHDCRDGECLSDGTVEDE